MSDMNSSAIPGKLFRHVLFALALCLPGPACSSSQLPALRYGSAEEAGMDAAALDTAVELFRKAVEAEDLQGVTVLVARNGIVVTHEAMGWRDSENSLPMEKDTLFRMASNTKPTIATAILMLAEAGKLSVGDPVSRHLPAFADGSNADITIRQLLTHTGGFRIGSIFIRPLIERSEEYPEAPNLNMEVARFAEIGPEEEPGTTYSYSNPGFNMLGAIIEVTSGKPLDLFLKEDLYSPLGMHDSLNHESKSDHSRMSKVYTRRNEVWSARWSPGDPPDYSFVRASGGMISTAWDYAIFCQMYLNGGVYNGKRILNVESVQVGTAAQTVDIYTPEELETRDSFYGYGWNVSKDGVFSHGGSDGTFAWVDPELKIIGLVFTQSPSGGRNPRNEFREMVTASIIEPDPELF